MAPMMPVAVVSVPATVLAALWIVAKLSAPDNVVALVTSDRKLP